jgi:hypothetical protein
VGHVLSQVSMKHDESCMTGSVTKIQTQLIHIEQLQPKTPIILGVENNTVELFFFLISKVLSIMGRYVLV